MNRIWAHELLKKGGSWLGEARSYLQWNVPNGDRVIWGSQEPVHITVKQIEELAAHVAEDAITQDRKEQIAKLKKIVDQCPIGWVDNAIVKGRWTKDTDIIEWIQQLKQLVETK
jgi:hypothetical protein